VNLRGDGDATVEGVLHEVRRQVQRVVRRNHSPWEAVGIGAHNFPHPLVTRDGPIDSDVATRRREPN
jgi:hypothetical protein